MPPGACRLSRSEAPYENGMDSASELILYTLQTGVWDVILGDLHVVQPSPGSALPLCDQSMSSHSFLTSP
ncbi:unnamed protein product [Arctogadus glacialis]